jgi:hypothetical protein
MKRNFCLILVSLVAVFICGASTHSFGQYTFTDISDPLGTDGTVADGISGNNIVGNYYTSDGDHGFLYNGSTYVSLNDPLGTITTARAISGNNVVGSYYNDGTYSGFIYDGSTYATLNDPLATDGTTPYGISGKDVVGTYQNASGTHGFLYNGSTYSTLGNLPNTTGTTIPFGIDGNQIVGTYIAPDGNAEGYVYNGTTYTIIQDPMAAYITSGTNSNQQSGTEVSGISGNNIVGLYTDGSGLMHGFLYNGTNYVTIDDPNEAPGGLEEVSGVDGNNLVGYDETRSGFHAFEATPAVPEPSSTTLFVLGLAGLAIYRRARSRSIPR